MAARRAKLAVTHREYIPVGSTAAFMRPTVASSFARHAAVTRSLYSNASGAFAE